MGSILVAAAILVAATVLSPGADVSSSSPIEPFLEERVPALEAPLEGRLQPAPYNFEFTGEDRLRLTVHNSLAGVVVGVHYRMHRPENKTHASREFLTPTSDRLATSSTFNIGRGYLLNCTIFVTTGSPKRGQTFVRLQVVRGDGAAAVVLGTIAQGYVTANQDRAWPGSPIEGSLEGDGVVRTISATDPAAGVDILETVPTGARWELTAFSIKITTSATVATRRPNVRLHTATTPFMRSANPQTIAASDAQVFFWGQGTAFETLIMAGANQAGLVTNSPLLAGYSVRTLLDSGQAGDTRTEGVLHVREWLEVQ